MCPANAIPGRERRKRTLIYYRKDLGNVGLRAGGVGQWYACGPGANSPTTRRITWVTLKLDSFPPEAWRLVVI